MKGTARTSNPTDDDQPPALPTPPEKLPPVSESEVHAACDQINAEGERPTYKLIRAILGRGSYTTIHAFIQTWRPAEIAAVPPPPETVLKLSASLTQAIWREAVQHGSVELLDERRRARAELDELCEAIGQVEAREVACLSELEQAEARLQAMRAQRDRAIHDGTHLREKLLRAQGEISSYKVVIERITGDAAGEPALQPAAE